MKRSDQYHKWVEWSDEDETYIGKCPDLITGIHGDDPKELYADLCEVIEDVIAHFESEGRLLPVPKVRPMQEVVQAPIRSWYGKSGGACSCIQWAALAADRKLTLRHVPPEAGPPTWLKQVFAAAGNPGGLELLGERGTSAPAEN